MTRTSKTFRLPLITQEQLVALSEAWGVSQAEVIIICLDRQHSKEIDMKKVVTCNKCTKDAQCPNCAHTQHALRATAGKLGGSAVG